VCVCVCMLLIALNEIYVKFIYAEVIEKKKFKIKKHAIWDYKNNTVNNIYKKLFFFFLIKIY
jgi:hypothetical protein